MRGKVIGFSQRNGMDWDCELLLDSGVVVPFDPYVGCAWSYDNRSELLGRRISVTAFQHETGVWLGREGTLIFLEKDKIVSY